MDPIQVPYYDADGGAAGTVTVDPAKLGGKIRRRLMFDAVLRHEANRRRGTHKTLTRSEVAGTSKKMFKQKGTGNARAGTKQAPQRKGGGTVFGPVPRSYRQDLNRKMRRLARSSGLLAKLADHEVAVIEGISFDKPSTKRLATLLDSTLGSADRRPRSVMVITDIKEVHSELTLSARNLERVAVNSFEQSNAYDLLFHRKLLITRAALESVVGQLQIAPEASRA